jgi:hypothetical protein
VTVPDEWDLTGFSGTSDAGYFRVDDGDNMSLEVKWVTEKAPISPLPWAKPAPVKMPNLDVRRESYFKALRDTAKKKKLTVTTKEAEPIRGVTRDHPERTAIGFTWTGDRKGTGAIWYCSQCHRVTIAQVTGELTSRAGFGTTTEALFQSLCCHDAEAGKRVWAIYDLYTVVPTEYALATAQLMNVYLRLSFRKGQTTRLSVEQWAVANVARKDAYLDDWVAANAKGELTEARYTVSETMVGDKSAVGYNGGPAFGQPMIEVIREIGRFQKPATRFSAIAWEEESANKIYLVESRRPRSEPDPIAEVAVRTTAGRV